MYQLGAEICLCVGGMRAWISVTLLKYERRVGERELDANGLRSFVLLSRMGWFLKSVRVPSCLQQTDVLEFSCMVHM